MLSALIRMTLTHTFSHVSLASNTPPALNHVTSVEGTLAHMLGYVPVAVHLFFLSLRANLVRRVVHVPDRLVRGPVFQAMGRQSSILKAFLIRIWGPEVQGSRNTKPFQIDV